MDRKPFPHLPGLVNVSATQIKLVQQCERKYSYQYVLGMREEQSAAQKFGNEVHKVLESYLRFGTPFPDTPAGRVAAQGKHMLPRPGSDLLVEEQLLYPMGALGAHLIGYLDLVNPRDPKNIVICDHKSSTAPSYALTDRKLLQDPQALVYAKWGFYRFGIAHLGVEWLYYFTSKEDPRQELGTKIANNVFHISGNHEQSWKKAKMNHWIRRCVEIKGKRIQPENLERNTNFCHAYRKQCHCMALCLQPKAGAFFGYENGKEHKEMGIEDRLRDRDLRESMDQLPVPENPPSLNPDDSDELKNSLLTALGQRSGVEPSSQVELENKLQDAIVDVDKKDGRQLKLTPQPRKTKKQTEQEEKEDMLAELRAALQKDEEPEQAPEPVPEPQPIPAPKLAEPAAPQAKTMPTDLAEAMGQSIEQVVDDFNVDPPIALEIQEFNISGFVVLVDCLPAVNKNSAPEPLIKLLAPFAQKVAETAKVAHWGLVPYVSKALLAAETDRAWTKNPPVGMYHADSSTNEYQAVLSVLMGHADLVLMGTR